MEDVDTHDFSEYDDETMFMESVVGEEHELLFLDSYLREAFRGRPTHGAGVGRSGGVAVEGFSEESTI